MTFNFITMEETFSEKKYKISSTFCHFQHQKVIFFGWLCSLYLIKTSDFFLKKAKFVNDLVRWNLWIFIYLKFVLKLHEMLKKLDNFLSALMAFYRYW